MEIIQSKQILETFKNSVKKSIETIGVQPHLRIIQVEGDKASDSYVKNKVKLGEELGMKVTHLKLSNDTSEIFLKTLIETLNNDEDTDGIIVQLPLPKHIRSRIILDYINPDKDVDGLGNIQMGLLRSDIDNCFLPCTAFGVTNILDAITDVEGKDVVIVNRSHLIGKPLQEILSSLNATVTMCHSKTKNLKEKMQNADIVITGVGKAKMFDKSYFKHGQIIIDCSMNFKDGKLCGDVDVESLNDLEVDVASGPGHTGPHTVLSLMANTVIACKRKLKK